MRVPTVGSIGWRHLSDEIHRELAEVFWKELFLNQVPFVLKPRRAEPEPARM